MVNQTVAKLAVMAGMVGMGMARGNMHGNVQMGEEMKNPDLMNIGVNQKEALNQAQEVQDQKDQASRLLNTEQGQNQEQEQKPEDELMNFLNGLAEKVDQGLKEFNQEVIKARVAELRELKEESAKLNKLVATIDDDAELVKAVEKQDLEKMEALANDLKAETSKFMNELEEKIPEESKEEMKPLFDQLKNALEGGEEIEQEAKDEVAEYYKKAYLENPEVKDLVTKATKQEYQEDQLNTEEILKIVQQVEDYEKAEYLREIISKNAELKKEYAAIIVDIENATNEQLLEAQKTLITKDNAESIREQAKAIKERVDAIDYSSEESMIESEEKYEKKLYEESVAESYKAYAESCKAKANADEELSKRIANKTDNKEISAECQKYAAEQWAKELKKMKEEDLALELESCKKQAEEDSALAAKLEGKTDEEEIRTECTKHNQELFDQELKKMEEKVMEQLNNWFAKAEKEMKEEDKTYLQTFN